MNAIAFGIVLRFGQFFLESALTLVVGAVVAGILRRMVGPAGTRHLFGSGMKGLFRGWLAGVLLPVCSLGVIPVAREMRRVGVPGGTILSFVLAAPLLNPISFLYGLTLADPITILTFSAFSLILSTGAGILWDRVFAGSNDTRSDAERAARADAEPLPAYGIKRIVSVVVTTVRELSGSNLLYFGIGLGGSALLAGAIPNGSFQKTMQHDDPSSPALMVAIALVIFSSPLSGMMKIGLMFDHGNSVGAAFVLFSLGIGVCLGTLVWLVREFRPARVVPWFATYLVLVLGLAYIAQPLLDDPRRERIDHTHAFDDYSCPFPYGIGDSQLVLAKWSEKWTPLERPAVYGLIALVPLGGLLRLSRSEERMERWLATASLADGSGPMKYDLIVPGPVLAGVALIGLVAFSIAGAYLYYPDRQQCLDAMFAVYAEARVAVNTNDPERGRDKTAEATLHLERWDLLVRKLEVGTYLRSFGLTADQKQSAYDLREAIEVCRDHLRDGERDAARNVIRDVETAYQSCKRAYLP